MPTAYPRPPDQYEPSDPRRHDRPSRWVRLRVRWKKRQLDADLAAGADPRSSAELSLRAEQLIDPATRAQTAAGLENLYRLATEGPGSHATTAMVRGPFERGRVAANRQVLAELAGRLRSSEPLSVRGLAMASVLLEDPDGPLYAGGGAAEELELAVRAVLSALEPRREMGERAHGPRAATRAGLIHGQQPVR